MAKSLQVAEQQQGKSQFLPSVCPPCISPEAQLATGTKVTHAQLTPLITWKVVKWLTVENLSKIDNNIYDIYVFDELFWKEMGMHRTSLYNTLSHLCI